VKTKTVCHKHVLHNSKILNNSLQFSMLQVIYENALFLEYRDANYSA